MTAARVGSLALAVLLVVAATTIPTFAQSRGAEDTLGWHTVRPGDTLEGITREYLGTVKLWRENWRLNPDIENPDLLQVGRRLRVILDRQLPPQTATVLTVERRVEAKPFPNPWSPATIGDLLKEQDGVRTFSSSSTEIGFDDGTSLMLTENSLVFLREVAVTLTGVDRETIEVVEGQADLAARPARADRSHIEVVIGDVRAQPRVDSTGTSSSRLRKSDDGSAQVMVYSGRAAVAAAGREVDVPAGMGTTVALGAAPRPPERLLPAPQLSAPAERASLAFANPVLSWREVASAASYTVEICADPRCASLVARRVGVAETSMASDPLPAAPLYWRVTAVSASGLDGRPARPRRLEITSDLPDLEPPVVVLVGDHGLVSGADGAVLATAGGGFQLVAHDDVTGVAWVRCRIDGGAEVDALERTLRFPGQSGAHSLAVSAADRLGRTVTFTIAVETEDRPVPTPVITRAPRPSGGPATAP